MGVKVTHSLGTTDDQANTGSGWWRDRHNEATGRHRGRSGDHAAGRGVHGRRAQHQRGQARGQRAYEGCGRAPVTITPANGATAADPLAGITVTAKHGTLTSVVVHSAGGAVSGSMSQADTVWRSQWALAPSQSYTVTATVSGGGTGTSTFRTLTPAETFRTEILQGYNQTYGVGQPIILYFSQKITNKAAVERALQLTTSKPVVGAWYWDDACGMAPPAPTSGRGTTGRPAPPEASPGTWTACRAHPGSTATTR